MSEFSVLTEMVGEDNATRPDLSADAVASLEQIEYINKNWPLRCMH